MSLRCFDDVARRWSIEVPSLVLSSGVQARLCGFGVVSWSRFVLGGVALFSMAIPVSMAPVLGLLWQAVVFGFLVQVSSF